MTMLHGDGGVNRSQEYLNCLTDPDVVRAPEPQHPVHGSRGDGNLGVVSVSVSPRPQQRMSPITRLYQDRSPPSTFARIL